jgi:hypothetical protein
MGSIIVLDWESLKEKRPLLQNYASSTASSSASSTNLITLKSGAAAGSRSSRLLVSATASDQLLFVWDLLERLCIRTVSHLE